MGSRFSEFLDRYIDKKLPIIPIGPGSKAPGVWDGLEWRKMPNWTENFSNRLATEWEYGLWRTWPDAGIGMPLGSLSGLIALDFDHDHDGLHDRICKMLPSTPSGKRGQKGFTVFYRHNGETSKQWRASKNVVIELLSHGRQTVLPPSLHPEGVEYTWIGRPIYEVSPEEIPFLPDGFIDILNDLFTQYRTTEVYEAIHYDGQASEDDITDALRYVDADDYNVWTEVGMALKDELGDRGFDIWDQYSRRSGKYNPKGMEAKWRSFRRTGKGIGSVFYWAHQSGWVRPIPNSFEIDRSAIEPGGNLGFLIGAPESTEPSAAVPHFPTAPPPTTDAPGLLGEIINWMLRTALWPSRELATAAAIPLLGAIKSHRVQTPGGLRTNVYAMGIAGSGMGKDHNRKAADAILRASDYQSLIGGSPASAAGLLRALGDANGRLLLQIDEFGRILKQYSGKNSGHQSGIPNLLLEVFSSANTTLMGMQYSNPDGKRDRQDIDQPCLCVHGTSVPRHVMEAMSSAEALDGFLARWLYFEEKEFKLHPQSVSGTLEPPEAIIQEVREWRQMPTNAYPKGNIDLAIRPQIVPMAESASKLLTAFRLDMRRQAMRHWESGSGMEALYQRTAEHAEKIALIASPRQAITVEAMEWGIGIALGSTERLCDIVRHHVADNEAEAELKRVLRTIQSEPNGIARPQLTRRTQWVRTRQRRNEIIQELVDSNQILVFSQDGKQFFKFIAE